MAPKRRKNVPVRGFCVAKLLISCRGIDDSALLSLAKSLISLGRKAHVLAFSLSFNALR